jgi:pimeloyl-ACP methyl ester carboxylesterase
MNAQTNQKRLIEIREIPANGLTFRCRLCGMENQGEPVIFLHGFPETSHLWERILCSFANAGYRCLAFDQRGYSLGARPKEIDCYDINVIASDAIAIADGLGWQNFHLVGHDWGAACGWTILQLHPQRVVSWSALSIPHLKAFEIAKTSDPDQKKRSWYMSFFQIPLLPETILGWVVSGERPSLWKFSSDEEISDYLTVFREFEGRRATLNWYRANNTLAGSYGEVFVPSLLLWGNQDPVVGRAGVEMTKQYMKGEYSLIELEAGHALVQEQFHQVSQALLDHVQKHPIGFS